MKVRHQLIDEGEKQQNQLCSLIDDGARHQFMDKGRLNEICKYSLLTLMWK